MTISEEKREKTLLYAAVLVLGCLAVVIWDQEVQWRMREDYRFGYLVPVFFAYVLHERWEKIRELLFGKKTADAETAEAGAEAVQFVEVAAKSETANVAAEPVESRPVWRGYDRIAAVILFPALFFFALGAGMRAINGPNIFATYFNTGGFIGIAVAALWLFSERNVAGHLLAFRERKTLLLLFTFPVLVWLISGPLLHLLDTSVRTFLLVRVGIIVAWVLNGIGMDVSACQGIITLPKLLPDGRNDIVGVSDACSGVRSLTACIFMGAFLSATFVNGPVRKLVLLTMSLVFAVILNLIRTTFLTMWAYKNGSQSLEWDLWLNPANSPDYTLGNVHDVAGYTAMGATFLLLLASLPIVNLHISRLVRRP